MLVVCSEPKPNHKPDSLQAKLFSTMENNRNNIMNHLGFVQNNEAHQHTHSHSQLDGDAETTFNAAIDSMFAGVVEQAPDDLPHHKRRRLEQEHVNVNVNDERTTVEDNMNGTTPNHVHVNVNVALDGHGHSFENVNVNDENPQYQDQHQDQSNQHHHQNHLQHQRIQTEQHLHPQQHHHHFQQGISPFVVVEAPNFQDVQHQQQQQQQQQQQHHQQPILPTPPNHAHSTTVRVPVPVPIPIPVQEPQIEVPLQPIQPQKPLAQQQHQQQNQQQSITNSQRPIQQTNTWTTDHVSEARRRMNTLIQRQQSAQAELMSADEALKRSQVRVEVAKKAIEATARSVHQGTEELTDALLQEPTHWNAMYRKLKEFQFKYGHADVKRNLNSIKGTNVEVDPDIAKLGAWIGRVRLEAKRPAGHPDQIEPYKIIALNRVGFNWDPRENYWMERFEELKRHFASADKKKKMPNRKTPLGVWSDGQVLEYNKWKAGTKPCYITKERIDLLHSIGFVFNRMHAAWMNNYNELKKFQDEYGHTMVSVNYGDKSLFRWVAKQKKKYKNFKEGKKPSLTEDQVKLLRDLNFFQSEKRYSGHRRDRRFKSSRSKGRPKSSSLIPQQDRKLANQSIATNNITAASATSTTVGTVAPANLPMPKLPSLPINDENFNAISHEIIDEEDISEHGQLNESQHDNEARAHTEMQLEHEHNNQAQVDEKMSDLDTTCSTVDIDNCKDV